MAGYRDAQRPRHRCDLSDAFRCAECRRLLVCDDGVELGLAGLIALGQITAERRHILELTLARGVVHEADQVCMTMAQQIDQERRRRLVSDFVARVHAVVDQRMRLPGPHRTGNLGRETVVANTEFMVRKRQRVEHGGDAGCGVALVGLRAGRGSTSFSSASQCKSIMPGIRMRPDRSISRAPDGAAFGQTASIRPSATRTAASSRVVSGSTTRACVRYSIVDGGCLRWVVMQLASWIRWPCRCRRTASDAAARAPRRRPVR